MRRLFARILCLSLLLVALDAMGQSVPDTTIPCPESGCSPIPAPILSAQAWNDYLDGSYDLALSQYQEILETAPNDSLARVGQVIALRRLGQDSEAVVLVRKIIRDNPRDAAAALAYSDLLQPNMRRHGTLSNADSCWFWARRAVALDSNFSDAWMSYWVEATMRAQDGDADRAIAHLARLGQWTPATQALNRLALENCPKDAVLVLGGDSDYLGIRQLQLVNGLRRDVHLEGSLLDAPRYLINRMRAGKIPAILDSAQIDSLDQDTTATTTLGARVTGLLQAKGHWPVVSLGWSKGTDGWEPLYQAGRSTYFNTTLDRLGDSATAREKQENVQRLIRLDPSVFAGPAASVVDVSPIRRRTKCHAATVFMQATYMMRQEKALGHKEAQDALAAWRTRLVASVAESDAEFHERVKVIEKMEAQERAQADKGKAKTSGKSTKKENR